MKTRTTRLSLFALTSALVLMSENAFAQIGPDLRPPGLTEDHPVESYYKDQRATENYLQQSFELNAGDVVFSAAKKRQFINEAPSTIHVITDREINAHGWRTLAEILRHVPGVQTLTTKSGFQSVMIRGLVGTEDNNSRILWLQNGVPMNDVRDSGIWLDETYPVEMIKRIEVVLGPGSALYGSGAFQGVVNIFTKEPGDINRYGEYRVAMQNNLTFKASAIAAYNSKDKDLGVLAHVAGNTTQGAGLVGDYVYTNYAMDQGSQNANGRKNPTAWRYENIDSNSDKSWYNIDFKFHYNKFKWNLGFTDIYAGGDGSETVPNVAYDMGDAELFEGVVDKPVSVLGAYRFNRREFYNDFIYETAFNDDVSLLGILSYRFGEYDQKDYGIGYVSSTGDSAEGLNTDFKAFQHKLYALAQVNWQILKTNQLIGGLVMEYQHIDSGDFVDGNSLLVGDNNVIASDRINAQVLGHTTPSIFLQDEQRLWNDRIILTLGGRFDAYRVYLDDHYKPDYAPSWRFAFLGKWTDWMTMRLSYGYSFKEPSLYQLYAYTYEYAGDPKLEPENLHNIELSFLFTPTYFMKIRMDAFATFMDNLIITKYETKLANATQGISGRYMPKQAENGAQIYGFELSYNASFGKNWEFYTHYNFLYSLGKFNEGKKSLVPDDAMHRFKLGATYMNDNLTADLAMFLVGGTPETDSNYASNEKYKTPFYAIFQPQITVALPLDIGLMLQGSYAFSENMTKSPTYRYYYEKQSVPVPRYSIMMSLQYPFKNAVNN